MSIIIQGNDFSNLSADLKNQLLAEINNKLRDVNLEYKTYDIAETPNCEIDHVIENSLTGEKILFGTVHIPASVECKVNNCAVGVESDDKKNIYAVEYRKPIWVDESEELINKDRVLHTLKFRQYFTCGEKQYTAIKNSMSFGFISHEPHETVIECLYSVDDGPIIKIEFHLMHYVNINVDVDIVNRTKYYGDLSGPNSALILLQIVNLSNEQRKIMKWNENVNEKMKMSKMISHNMGIYASLTAYYSINAKAREQIIKVFGERGISVCEKKPNKCVIQ